MTDRPEFIDNREGRTLAKALNNYLDHLQDTLGDDPDLDIATAYFNPGGYFSVADRLQELGEIRILLGAEPDEKDRQRWRRPGEPRGERYHQEKVDQALQQLESDLARDRNLLGFSREVNQQLLEMVNFLRSDRVKVRRYEKGFIHGKAFLFSHDQGVVAGSSNFTRAGLNTNLELNLGQYQPHVTGKVEDWFDDLWQEATPYDLAALYEERFEEHHPYLIYLRVLWERYKDEIQAEREEHEGRIQLTTFQNDGVDRAKRFLDQHNGVVVADEVGLGKTFIAGEILREVVQERRQNALVVAPAYLRDGMWKPQRAKWNFQFEVLSYSEVRNDRQLTPDGGSQNLQLAKDEYQLVVIDEAHAFRNPNTQQAQALRTLLRGSPRKDLVLLTATPVNNSLWDLYYQLSYFIKNDAAFAHMGIRSLRDRFREAQSEDPSELSPDLLFDVLDETTVRRTRRFIKEYYKGDTIPTDDGEIRIRFPDPTPKRVDYTFEKTVGDEFFDDVAQGLAAGEEDEPELTLARYRPSHYIEGEDDPSELPLVGLLRTGMLKRFESSSRAFYHTVQRMIDQNRAALDLLEEGYYPEADAIDEWVEAADDATIDEAIEESDRAPLDPNRMDVEQFRSDIENDIQVLKRWRDYLEDIRVTDDEKLHALRDTLVEIVEQADGEGVPEDEGRRNRKVLIFSYFEHTVDWILDYLQHIIEEEPTLEPYRGRITGVAGEGGKLGHSRTESVQGFAPEATGAPDAEDRFDILVTTDVLGQGVNLQDARNVINYDLPWNPMRVVQRNGRIDRINSPHSRIFTYVFFPEDRLDDLLELEHRVRRKLAQTQASIGLQTEVVPGIETADRNFADRRDDIQRLKDEDAEMFEEGGPGSAAYSGEEYRQELRRALRDHEDDITSLPWAAGYGFRGEHPGYFFCARVGEEVFNRFVPRDHEALTGEEGEEIVRDTLTCLRRIECDWETDRVLPDEMKEEVFDAWEVARQEIYQTWESQTDPAEVEPEIRKLFHEVADHLRDHPPADLEQDRLEELISSVEAPHPRREERELREVWKRELEPVDLSEALIDKVEELGWAPYEAPEPLPPIEEDEVQLVCWLAVADSQR